MNKNDNETYEEFCLRQAEFYAFWYIVHRSIDIIRQMQSEEFRKRVEEKNNEKE